ncbi:MAG: thiolase family protein [Leptospiraceae bacterium]|nr:thiolase family protein [Leptospiraceae bacterium]
MIYLHSPSLSKFGKSNDSVLELSRKTAEKSLSSFPKEKIDALVFTSFAPEAYTKEFHIAAKLASSLHLKKNIFCIRTETASSSGASSIAIAKYLLESNKFDSVLIVGTEIMSRLNREDSNLLLGSVLSETQQKFSMSMAQGAAMIARLYLKNFSYHEEDLFYIAEKLHANGFENPNAQLQKKISKEDYLSAPKFATPLGLYDISPLSDGSASLVLSKFKSDFELIGFGYGRSEFDLINPNPSFEASKIAFEQAFSSANLSPKEITVAELHDAFTIFEVIGAEDSGLVPKGEGLRFVKEGYTNKNGKLPINPSGGLKTRGHPIGASGLAQIVELVSFMKEKGKEHGLTHSIGGLATNNFATIIRRLK